MRLWHYKLIPYLPKDMLVSQWRECIAIKRQWEKGTLKHRLVSYVDNYNKQYFLNYLYRVMDTMYDRKIKFQSKFYDEIRDFCWNGAFVSNNLMYTEHNNRYLKQCLYNLQEKADRGIVSNTEWKLIENKFKEELK